MRNPWFYIDWFLHEGFSNEESRLYRIVNDIVMFLVIFSVLSIVLESVDTIYAPYQAYFDLADKIVVGIFTFEYLANIYVAPRKRAYILGPWGFIDLFAILPSYVGFIDARFLKIFRIVRVLRFLRMMRLLRLLKLAKGATDNYETSKAKKFDTLKMDLQIYFVALFSVLVVFSTLVYYAERGVDGTAFTNIPKAMWWCIVTITTVGYGDMYPVTVLGRFIAAFAMLCGLALFGLLMNVIGKSMMSSLFGSSDVGEVDVEEVQSQLSQSR